MRLSSSIQPIKFRCIGFLPMHYPFLLAGEVMRVKREQFEQEHTTLLAHQKARLFLKLSSSSSSSPQALQVPQVPQVLKKSLPGSGGVSTTSPMSSEYKKSSKITQEPSNTGRTIQQGVLVLGTFPNRRTT